jgi:hypothetical protein
VVGTSVMTEQLTFADDMIVVCYGNAKPTDLHLLSTIRAMDNGIFKYLKRRENQQQRRKTNARSRQTKT